MSFALIGKMLADRIGQKPVYPTDGPLAHSGEKNLRKLRLGAVLDMLGAEATFITAEAAGSFLKRPQSLPALIAAYGKIADGDYTIHRFYFADCFLQVITHMQGIVQGEVKLFQKLAEIMPATKDEWDLWLIGTADVPPLLTGPTINWQDTTEFVRVWSPGSKAAEPKRFIEGIDTGQADTPPGVNNASMLFSRPLGAETEWLQLSMCRTGSERWIEAYVGLTFAPGELAAI